jgi:hypothetical protein
VAGGRLVLWRARLVAHRHVLTLRLLAHRRGVTRSMGPSLLMRSTASSSTRERESFRWQMLGQTRMDLSSSSASHPHLGWTGSTPSLGAWRLACRLSRGLGKSPQTPTTGLLTPSPSTREVLPRTTPEYGPGEGEGERETETDRDREREREKGFMSLSGSGARPEGEAPAGGMAVGANVSGIPRQSRMRL